MLATTLLTGSTCRAEQEFIVRRLRDLGWEVLGAGPNMSVTPADSTERKLLDQVSTY